jgi:NADH:ubiquinone oxidoreductase subunit K
MLLVHRGIFKLKKSPYGQATFRNQVIIIAGNEFEEPFKNQNSTFNIIMLSLNHFLFVSIALFAIGVIIIITKRNAVVVLMGIELILNAANINLVVFSRYDQHLQGQMFALFIIAIAASEAAVALAIIVKVYRYFKTVNLDEINKLKG